MKICSFAAEMFADILGDSYYHLQSTPEVFPGEHLVYFSSCFTVINVDSFQCSFPSLMSALSSILMVNGDND